MSSETRIGIRIDKHGALDSPSVASFSLETHSTAALRNTTMSSFRDEIGLVGWQRGVPGIVSSNGPCYVFRYIVQLVWPAQEPAETRITTRGTRDSFRPPTPKIPSRSTRPRTTERHLKRCPRSDQHGTARLRCPVRVSQGRNVPTPSVTLLRLCLHLPSFPVSLLIHTQSILSPATIDLPARQNVRRWHRKMLHTTQQRRRQQTALPQHHHRITPAVTPITT